MDWVRNFTKVGHWELNDTDNRVKFEITNLLIEGKKVEIYFFQPKVNFHFDNEDIMISISKSLEEYLITKYQPKINIRENKSY